MSLRSGGVLGKVSTCKACKKQFKYVVTSNRYTRASKSHICKPCFNKVDSSRDYGFFYEGYLWE